MPGSVIPGPVAGSAARAGSVTVASEVDDVVEPSGFSVDEDSFAGVEVEGAPGADRSAVAEFIRLTMTTAVATTRTTATRPTIRLLPTRVGTACLAISLPPEAIELGQTSLTYSP